MLLRVVTNTHTSVLLSVSVRSVRTMSKHLFPFAAGIAAGFGFYNIGVRIDTLRRDSLSGAYRASVIGAQGHVLGHMNVLGNACTHCGYVRYALRLPDNPVFDFQHAADRNSRLRTKYMWIRDSDADLVKQGGQGRDMYSCCERID